MPPLSRPARLLLTAAGYFLGGYLGLTLPYVGSQVTLIWPASGIAVALLLRWGRGLWPAVWLGAFLVNWVVGDSLPLAAAIACGNTLGPYLACRLLERLKFQPDLDSRRDILAFVLAGAMGPMLVTASLGTLALHLFGALPAGQAGAAWIGWWLGDTLGVLLVAPPLLAYHHALDPRATRHEPQPVIALAILLGVGLLFFAVVPYPSPILLLLPLLPLVWLATLRNTWNTASAILAFAACVVLATALGRGPFVSSDPRASMAMLWTYLATLALLNLLVTAVASGHRRTMRALADREASLAEAQRIAHLGSWSLDLRTNHLEWSAQIFRIFELDPTRFGASYQAFLDAIHPDDRERVNQAYTDSLATRTPYEITHRLRMADGRIKYVHERCETSYDADGKPLRSIGTVQDITERHLVEEELARYRQHLEDKVAERTRDLELARDAAESANRAKSAFLANMSHELRTPLNAILGFAQLMERDPDLAPEQRRNLETINRSGRHLLSLINDVLQLSRIEAGRAVLHNQAFDLDDTLRAVEEMIRVRALGKGLDFALRHADGLPGGVMGDPERLRQVLLNLLSNAVKYTERGQVSLEVAPAAGERLCFTVRDTGPGIAPEEQERIFQPFYQTAHGAALQEGAGLGLAISREYVRLMGGELTLDSTPGRGCAFAFTVHLPPVAEQDLAAERASQVRGLAEGETPRRVLVAEDNPDNRRLLEQLLRAAGFQVETARDGREAEALFLAWHPHFIWMDMRMPVMDGYEATRRIRCLPGGDQVRIAALTASAFEEDRGAILDAGCDEVLAKPLEEGPLFEIMGRLLGVRYRYDSGARPEPLAGQALPDPAALAALPVEPRQALRRAAEQLDQERARLAIDRIAAVQPELAAALAALVEGYRFDVLAQLLEDAPTMDDAPR